MLCLRLFNFASNQTFLRTRYLQIEVSGNRLLEFLHTKRHFTLNFRLFPVKKKRKNELEMGEQKSFIQKFLSVSVYLPSIVSLNTFNPSVTNWRQTSNDAPGCSVLNDSNTVLFWMLNSTVQSIFKGVKMKSFYSQLPEGNFLITFIIIFTRIQ